uniref:Uncharacterized protein n=1 Tax=Tanacetum cinerariifolium TaxID=118510 RepID=A0A6L2LWB0_TANCI|nr:hypothetical protein [Tanacetum cinerariifolium]
MHQFWNTIKKIKETDAYQFKLDKKKFRIDTKEVSYSGKCDMLSAIHTNQMHQLWRTFDAIINWCISGKSSGLNRLRPSRAQILWDSKAYKTYLDFATRKATPTKVRKFKKVASPSKKLSPILEEEPTEKPKRAKKLAKKSTTMTIACVVIKDTPGVSVSKKKAPTKVDRGKGMDLLSEAALLEQQDKTTTTDKETGTIPGVPDVPKYHSESEKESWGNSKDDDRNDDDSNDDDDADGDKEVSDSEKTDSDEDENPNLNQNDDDEEEYKEEEYVHTLDNYEFTDDEEEYEELYKDVNVRLSYVEHGDEGKEDAEKNIAGHDAGTQETTYEQVKDDEHVILTTVHDTQKTEVPLQSSSILSDFANQFLNLDNPSPADTEINSMMNIDVRHEEPSTQTPPLLTIHVMKAFRSYTAEFKKKAKDEKKRYTDLVKKSVKEIIKDEVKSQLLQILPKEVSEFATPMIQSTITESLKNVVLRDHEDKDKYEDPPAGLDQGLKKQKTSKDVEPSKGSKSKESKSSLSNETKSQPKSSGKSTQVEELVFEFADIEMPQNQGSDLGNTDDQPNVEAASKHDWFKKLERPPSLNNPEGKEYLFDLSKPLPLIEDQGRQVVPVKYFIKNDLEYLKGGSSSKKYMTSTIKTNAAKYGDIQGIEDMVLSLWSPVKVKDLKLGVKSYQKKLIITRPKTFRYDISKRTPYTAYNNPQGIIYVDKFKRSRLMRSDELYKFSDGTLPSV